MMTADERRKEGARPAGSNRSRSSSVGGVLASSGWIGAVLLLLIALRIPIFLGPGDPDSMAFAYGGWVITEGGTPYVDFVDNKPPGIYLLNACVLSILPSTRASILLFEMLWILVTTGVVFLLARRLIGPTAAKWAVLLFVFTLNLEYLAGSGNMTETWALLPVALAYLAFFCSCRGGIPKSGLLLLTGALFALAMQFRPTAGLPLVPLSGAVIALPSSGPSPAGRVRSLVWMWAGVAAVGAAVAAVLAAWGALGSFVEIVLLGNLHYVGSVGSFPVHRIFKALGYSGPALVFALIAIPRSLRSDDSVYRVLAFCFLADLAGALVSRHWYGHYFIQPLVPAVILAVGFLGGVADRWRKAETIQSGRPAGRVAKTVLVAALFLVLLGIALKKEVRNAVGLAARRSDATGDIRLLYEASDYISDSTSRNDLILIHGFGTVTNLYFLSHRMAPTRYFHTHYLDPRKLGAGSGVAERARQYLEDIMERNPMLVILPADGDIQLPEPYAGEFRSFLKTRYLHDVDIGEFRIFRRRLEPGEERNG